KAKKNPPAVSALNNREQTRALVEINLPLERITTFINQFDFKSQSKGVANIAIIGDVRYDGAGAVGHITLTPSDQKRFPIEVKAPFRWNGTIGGFDVKADGDVTIDFGITVGPDWCPLVEFGDPAVRLSPDKAINLAHVPYATTVIRNAIGDALRK